MIAEVLIYVPSIANFRLNWLADRVAVAHTAALVLDAGAERPMVPGQAWRETRILDSLGATAVAMKMGNQRRLLAVNDMPPRSITTSTCASDRDGPCRSCDAFETLFCAPTATSCAWSARRRWAATSSRS